MINYIFLGHIFFFLLNHWLISRWLHLERCNRKYKSVEMDQVWTEKNVYLCSVQQLLSKALTKWMNQGNHQIDCNSRWNSGVLAAHFSSTYYGPFKQCAKHWKYNPVLQIKHLFLSIVLEINYRFSSCPRKECTV